MQSGGKFSAEFIQSVDISTKTSYNTNRGFYISPDGTKLFVCSYHDNNLVRLDLSVPFDLSSAIFHSRVGITGFRVHSISFSQDGTKIYYGTISHKVVQRNLSVPWDIERIGMDVNSISTTFNYTQGISFSPDGRNLFITGEGAGEKYTLSDPWNISTSLMDGLFSGSPGPTNGNALINNGKYIILKNAEVYKLNSPYNLPISGFISELDVLDPFFFHYDPINKFLFTKNYDGFSIHKYKLS